MSKHINFPDIEEVIQLIIEGRTFREMAAHFGLALSTFHDFTTRAEHSTRVRNALLVSANAIQEKGIEALINAPSNLPEISRARELASHYRWLAAKRCPAIFSDKFQADITQTTKTIKVNVPGEEQDEDNTTE